MYGRRIIIPLTSDGAGAVTAYSDELVSGLIQQLRYINTSFTGTPVFTVTSDLAGESIWTETIGTVSLSRAPRQATHSIAGAALLYAAGGTAVSDRIAIGNDRIKVVVSGAGAAKVAVLHVLLV